MAGFGNAQAAKNLFCRLVGMMINMREIMEVDTSAFKTRILAHGSILYASVMNTSAVKLESITMKSKFP